MESSKASRVCSDSFPSLPPPPSPPPPPPPPPPPHMPSRTPNRTPHPASNISTKKTKYSHHYHKVPSPALPIATPSAAPISIPTGYYLARGIPMAPYSCNDPSCGLENGLPGYIVEELSQSGDSIGEIHTPVVHLPENVPPPIVISETGYPMGIAGPDGSPAWAKPKASTRPFKHEHGHEHNRHKNFHRSHHHNYPHAGFQGGPEYLVPMGTPISNPYGPGIVFLPPKDPRIIPCRPAENLGHFDYDDLDTIEGDRLHHQGRHPVFEDPNSEYARIKLRAEQNERARIEEIERDQALRNARKKEYQKNVWLNAMRAKQDQPDFDASISTHHIAAYDDERVININVRQPCDKCQELVTIETVHRRLSPHDASQGIGINLDSPAPKRVKEFLCEKCEVSEAEEKKNAGLLRKLVRQVVAEADTIKKAKENESSPHVTASHGRGVIHSEHPQSLDPRAALKEPLLHHDRNKSSRFENMPQDAALSNPTPHDRQSKHHLYGHTEANISDVYRDESDGEYLPAKEARVTQPRSSTNLGNRLSHRILAALDREHIVNKDNIRIISSKSPEDDEEEEVIVIRRARRHNDKNHNENRTHPTLVKSATENPEEALEALTRRLAHRLALSPTKVDSFHDATNLRNHTKEMYQEIESGSESSGYSAFVRKHRRSRAHAHQRQTNNRANHYNRGAHTHTANHHEPHHQHYRERIVEDDDENHPHYQRRRHTRPEDEPDDPSSNTTAGFFSNWGLFRKPTF
ncbi:hypothetical protein TWF225_009893 [Orbilia oligospora]|uniref:Uncharacterized protein n=1 Tax=Orbilia oligospora TaxID=2813651 RepID=A0A7C8PHE5_ORBOL|nr:hypothetical protein TWF751_008791 [Orbilia oligospora]KAF3173114.1 hypothetical protein TWF225_009893 [Orbilia oligospora]KAF3267515.1 hypothetical protein TWF128_009059 [Orbilia oligospora]KAF3267516.1 hypothetical protein TWF128_009059 [Orbilia oligospora]KAF3269260.1 hypothetical protein TWF217_009351 [Orbilia oligospora]